MKPQTKTAYQLRREIAIERFGGRANLNASYRKLIEERLMDNAQASNPKPKRKPKK